ncbi:hypothetical protein [Serratia nevei]|uniref:hypothetical protein n=1 Tax=Serratia nevei TaxID=2703794 RepID=UPI003FA6A50D
MCKLFASFGAKDIIVTQPRQGFTFDATSLEVVGRQWGGEEEITAQPPASAKPRRRKAKVGLVSLGLVALLA